MSKKVFLLSLTALIFSFSFLIYPSTIYGQVQEAEKRKCLQAEQVGGRTTTPPSPVSLNVSGKGFPPGENISIEFCSPSDEKTQCDVLGNTTAAGGKVKGTITKEGLAGHVPYAIWGAWKAKEIVGGAGGDQQGTFTFEDTKCVSIAWDPYGRVFDSQSLEPIPGIKVGILNSLNPQSFTQIRNNPQIVKADGAFNFLVEPGTYYLKVLNLPSNYSFTANPHLNPQYVTAYSKRDWTPALYKPNEPIVEKANNPEYRDIPLDPGNNTPSRFLLVNMPGSYEQMVFDSVTKYGGKISHPLSKVALVGQKSKKEIIRVTADKFGYWTVLLNNEKIPQDEPLVIKLIKVDLTTGKANEQNARITNDVVFEPILRTVQGYVRDANGIILPNAKVTVVLDAKNQTYYQTTADKDGYISIPTDKLPVFAYHLTSTSAKGNVSTSTLSEFAEKNKEYLTSNTINLMQETNKNQATFSPNTSQNPPPQTESVGSNKNLVRFIIILVLLVGLVAAFLSLKKKKKGRFPNRRS